MADAMLVAYVYFGEKRLEARMALDEAETWPGYHESAPLGKLGAWYGTHASHRFVLLDELEAIMHEADRVEKVS